MNPILNDNILFSRLEYLEDEEEERSRWNQFLEKALTISPIDSRAFRAGVIWNPLRGLTFKQNSLHTNVTSDGKIIIKK